MSCACVRVRVAQSIVHLHFCRCGKIFKAGGMHINIRFETICLKGAKDKSINRRNSEIQWKRC